jgi:nucleotide-binding universal stress UspA family protein
MERVRWIVVGTDFSPAAGRALLRAAALANELGAAVACTHAYDDAPGTSPQSDLAEGLQARLEEVAARTRAHFPNVRVDCFVRRGSPWDKLANVACDLGADMIVIGASGVHRRAGPSFVGSVVTRIAAITNRSVLVVPDQDASVQVPSL